MAGIQLGELSEKLSIPEIAEMRVDQLVCDFMPAAVTGLADGDVYAMHSDYSGRRAELYGESSYNSGIVAKTIARVALEDGMKAGVLRDFQYFAAQYFVNPNSPFVSTQFHSPVSVLAEGVKIDGQFVKTDHPPNYVLELGACLSSKSIQADQIKFITKGLRPFTYVPVTRLHFTNQSLIFNYDNLLGARGSGLALETGLYVGREDGIDSATTEMIRVQRANSAPTEFADVIICTGAQHSTAEQIERGVRRSYALLREGGLMVVKALSKPSYDELGADTIAGWAYESGFEENKTTTFETGLFSPGILLQSGHFGESEMRNIIFKKV